MCNLSWTHKFSLDFKRPAKGPFQYLREEKRREEKRREEKRREEKRREEKRREEKRREEKRREENTCVYIIY